MHRTRRFLAHRSRRLLRKFPASVILCAALLLYCSVLLFTSRSRWVSRAPAFYGAGYMPSDYPLQRMFLTRELINMVEAHQNPASCEEASFMVITDSVSASGFGSTIHQLGAYLALAINSNKVLAIDSSALRHWGPCDSASGSAFECFFKPITWCNHRASSNVSAPHTRDVVNEMPRFLEEVIDRAPTTMPNTPDRQVKYLWRAIASAYLLRLNADTSTQLVAQRRALLGRGPPPLIAVHVRRGDKGKEMTLRPVSRFVQAVKQVQLSSVRRGWPAVFLTTESEDVVGAFQEAFSAPPQLVYVDRERSNKDFSIGYNDTMADLLSLFVSLESTYFVGTLGSNWSRLVDELRRVWAAPSDGCCTQMVEVDCDGPLPCPVNTRNW